MLLALVVAACGGGGNPGGATATPTTPTVVTAVADFYIYTDKTSVNNSGTDKAQLTVVAVNSTNNIVVGATVAVATDKNSVFTPSGTTAVTDATGTYTGSVSIGADKSDRDVTISVTVNGIVKQTVIRIIGSKLTLQASNSNPAPGATVTLTATLLDYANLPIAGGSVTLSGSVSALQGQVLTTGTNGTVTKTFVAPATAGTYTIGASGSGVLAADYSIQVFTSSSAIPAAIIPAGALPSLSASPNVLSVNSAGSIANKSNLRFLFLDAVNSPIPNVRVRFDDVTTGLPKVGASISSGASTLYTDTSGTVSAQYIPGQNSSPTNGVTIKGCYSAVDFVSATDCPNVVSVSLTVAGQALSVSIGSDNLLEKGTGTYIKTFTVTVADSAGRAVPNAPVDISVDLTHFGKGDYAYTYGTGATAVTGYFFESGIVKTPSISTVPSALSGPSAYYPIATGANPYVYQIPGANQSGRVWCANEDANRNGNVDSGDNVNGSVDLNLQATLEPRKSDLLVRYADPAVTTTNASGILLIKVEYSQQFATWLAYRVRVTANVSGSQGLAERLFLTSFIVGDDENGSFLTGPYGRQACNNAN
nr:hypothetical protein [uncultured Albidiferax sp.]